MMGASGFRKATSMGIAIITPRKPVRQTNIAIEADILVGPASTSSHRHDLRAKESPAAERHLNLRAMTH